MVDTQSVKNYLLYWYLNKLSFIAIQMIMIISNIMSFSAFLCGYRRIICDDQRVFINLFIFPQFNYCSKYLFINLYILLFLKNYNMAAFSSQFTHNFAWIRLIFRKFCNLNFFFFFNLLQNFWYHFVFWQRFRSRS